MIYQMLSGRSPFHAMTEFLTFEMIMGHFRNEKPIEYPSTIPDAARDIIACLLQPLEQDRLGAGDNDSNNGYSALKSHIFFEGVDWDSLLSITPPYVPHEASLPSSSDMKDGAGTDWLLDSDPTPITSYYRMSDMKGGANGGPAGQQWNKFLREGENSVFSSTIHKKVVRVLYLTVNCISFDVIIIFAGTVLQEATVNPYRCSPAHLH